jgi:hypothetical protein
MTRTARWQHEDGATLVEMLIAVTVSGIIASAMAVAFFAIAHHREAAEDRLVRSQDAQFLANYVVTDAQSSGGQDGTDPEVSLDDATSCAPSPETGTPDPIVRFKWLATSSSGTTAKTVSYVKIGESVRRRYCSGTALVSDTVVAQSVAGVEAVCTPDPEDCSGTPSGVSLSVTETLGEGDTAPYQYSLAATFRKVPATGAPLPPSSIDAALVILGPSGDGLTTGNSSVLTIASGNTIISNSNIQLFRPTTLAGSPTILQDGTISCNHPTPGTCPTSTITNEVVDPYQAMTCPSTDLSGAPLPVRTGSSYQGPGIYTDELRISGDQPIVTGRHVLRGGFRRTGNGTMSGSGVLFCVENGSFWNAGGGSVSLTASTSGSDPFASIVVFQPRANTSPMQLRGGGTASYSHLVYAGGATVDLGGGGTLTSGSVMANAATLGGSSSANLG